MANQIALKVTLDDKGAVQGVEKITKSVEGLKKADAGLDWKGTEAGGKAARESNEGYTVLKGTLANLASTAVTAAVGGIKDAASAVVEIGSAFETSMSKVSALSGATGDDLAALEAKARELGSTTTFSASQAADALGYMALAGWDTQAMLAGVGPVLSLAQAGELDLAAASDLVTDYLSAFNMTAEDTGRMVDVLAYAQANANTTVDGLGQAFKNCAANCNAAGMDVETTSAAIAMMANQGLKGSEAGTALNAVMRDMTQRMEDGSIKIGDATVAVMDAQGNYRDFADILADVEAATDGMGDAEKAAALQSTFTADSIKGLNLMLNAGAGELSSFRDDLYGCAGAAEDAATAMTDNLQGDLAGMGSAFEELALKIYDGVQEPLRDAVQFVTGSVVPALTFLVEHVDYVAVALGGVAAAVAAMNFGKVASALSAVPKLLAGITGGPILLVVGALTALAAGAKWAYDNVQPFREAVDALAAELQNALGPVVDQAADAIGAVLPAAMEGASGVLEGVVVPAIESFAGFLTDAVVPAVAEFGTFLQTEAVPALQEFAGWAVDNVVPALQAMAGYVVSNVVPAVQQMAQWVADNVVPVLFELADFITGTVVPALGQLADYVLQNVVPAVMEGYRWFAENILPVLQAVAAFVVENVVPALAAVAEFVLGSLVPILSVIFETIVGTLGNIEVAWQAVWGVVSSVFMAVWEAISAAAEMFMGVIQGVIDAVSAGISGDWEGVWRGIGEVFSSIVNGILRLGANIFNALATTVSSIITGLFNTFSGIMRNIYNVASSIWNNIKSTVSNVANSLVSGVVGTFNGFVSTVTGIFDKAAYAITHPMETAKSAIKGIVDAIKGFFTGFKIQIPHIKLPHFSIKPSGWQIGDLLEGKIPSLGIDWYAKGGEFNSPAIIGVGEAGRETVLPLSNPRTMRNVGEAIAEAGGMGDLSAVLAELRAMRRLLEAVLGAPLVLEYNRREFARAVRDSEGY
ncbi:MAG: phage tail tape measure protein [Adlercreutzia sp.]|uniref:phage tail tape measure protein n=1 Tax=Adlercreutzia sp. TaxID=1872387 RepID=UPI002EC0FA62|nr:phage tail tape measure protein [Adlercreutzia sp.]MEE0308438.1 phage tail tape measure protein [Adlercreutzia sp.]